MVIIENVKKLKIMGKREKHCISILQIIISFICARILVPYMRVSNISVTVFPIAVGIYILQLYMVKNIDGFMKNKWWYLFFSIGISIVLIACKHMVIEFTEFYSDIMSNYILKYTVYDIFAFIVLVYTFMLLSFCAIKGLSAGRIKALVLEKNSENRISGVGVTDFKWVIILAVILFLCWLPYLILYYPGIIYGDSTISIGEAIGNLDYTNTHPFVFTMFVKLCIFFSNCLEFGNTLGCAIYSVLQMIYMASVFSYSICWLKNKNISKKVCFIVLLFFALSRFWGLHAISMWKDPIYAVAVYFYSLKLFDLIYSRGAVSKDKKYILQCVVAILIICFFRHNGQYVALVSLLLMISCFAFAKNKYMVKKGLILSIAITILFSGIVQGPVYRRFGIEGTATGAYGIPLQQVARTVVYEGNISNEEKSFLNEIMPLEKYIDNYSPGLVDHMKWSEDFNTEFFKEHKKEFLKVWMSLLIKNPILFIEAWAMETCGFWGLSYWELNVWEHQERLVSLKKCMILQVVVFLGKIRVLI